MFGYMKCYDFYAVTYDCGVYCIECLPDHVSVDDDEVSPIFAGEEWQTAPVCDVCGEQHSYMTILDEE